MEVQDTVCAINKQIKEEQDSESVAESINISMTRHKYFTNILCL